MTPIDDDKAASDASLLPRHLCRVMGFNKNHSSRTGTLYHLQVEDLGPIFDEATEAWVRRLNVIAYANYGEPTARIVYGKDHDLPDTRTHEHNRVVAQRIHDLAAEVALVLEEKEEGRSQKSRRAFTVRATTPSGSSGSEPLTARPRAPRSSRRAEPDGRSAAPPPELHRRRGGSSARRPPARARARDRARARARRDLSALAARGAADDILQATCAAAGAKESLRQTFSGAPPPLE